MSHIYVIGPPGGPVKVGYAASVALRFSVMQADNSAELVIHFTAHVGAAARVIEASAHRRLAASRVRGEWFAASPRQAIAAVLGAIDAAAPASVQHRPAANEQSELLSRPSLPRTAARVRDRRYRP